MTEYLLTVFMGVIIGGALMATWNHSYIRWLKKKLVDSQADNNKLRAGQPWLKGATTEHLLRKRIAQLEEELASRTETLDAIKDGKTAEYWRTCFYHQQDIQRQLEEENAELKRENKKLLEYMSKIEPFKTWIEDMDDILADARLADIQEEPCEKP